MERRQLEFFLAIAEAGSFTRAAQVLHIAQPSLSYSMRTLEPELGSASSSGTVAACGSRAAGEALVGPARRAVRSFGLAASAVRGVSDGGLRPAPDRLEHVVGGAPARRADRRVPAAAPARALRGDRPGSAHGGARPGAHRAGRLRPGRRPAAGRRAGQPRARRAASWSPCCRPGRVRRPTATVEELVRHGLIGTPRGTALRGLLDAHLEAAGQRHRRDGRDGPRRLGRAAGPRRGRRRGAARGHGGATPPPRAPGWPASSPEAGPRCRWCGRGARARRRGGRLPGPGPGAPRSPARLSRRQSVHRDRLSLPLTSRSGSGRRLRLDLPVA